MGIKQRNEHVSKSEIDHLLIGLRALIDWVGGVEALAEKVYDGLAEVEAMRRAQRCGRLALDWSDFRDSFKDHENAEIVSWLQVDKFEVGRCWLKAPDGITLNRAEFARGWLKNALWEKYGARFQVKISGPVE